MNITLIVIAVVVVLLVLYIISIYNKLNSLKVAVDGAWSDIEVQLKKRVDMLGNLQEVVKGYASHESKIFEKFADARSDVAKATQSQNPVDAEAANVSFGAAVQGMRMIAEQYPDLKANENFIALQNSISNVEEDIENARRFYNGTVKGLNTAIVVFPSNIIAGMFNITSRDFFETGQRADLDKGLDTTNPAVKF